jgi:hypothetical protein
MPTFQKQPSVAEKPGFPKAGRGGSEGSGAKDLGGQNEKKSQQAQHEASFTRKCA